MCFLLKRFQLVASLLVNSGLPKQPFIHSFTHLPDRLLTVRQRRGPFPLGGKDSRNPGPRETRDRQC